MNKSVTLVTVIFLLISTVIIYVPSTVKSDGYGDYPVPISGAWTIINDTYVGNETIILNGNLTVMPGATLTMRNVTLLMNNTATEQWRIDVRSGATLRILDLDGDNITTDDASNITVYDPTYTFLFMVRNDSTFEMRNSKLSQCGGGYAWPVDPPAPTPVYYGLFVQTDNATIDHNLIFNNAYGIVLYSSDAVVSNNTIEWNEYAGLTSMIWSNATIENNLFRSNLGWGIRVDGGSNSDPKPANPIIRNNTILDTGRGTNTANGIHVVVFSRPIIENNVILRSTEDGMYFREQSSAIVKNNQIDDARYGIATSSVGYLEVVNTTISNTTEWDVSVSGGQVNLINTTFNKSKVVFQDSFSYTNLTVNWFLHTYIKDNYGNPVAGATVRVRDNANGTSDQNFTTDADGWVRWVVVTEKVQNKSGNLSFTSHNITVERNGYLTTYTEVEMNESRYITITLQADEKPIADAGLDQSVNEDQIVYFNGSGSTDDVGIIWYNWSFGDGSYDYGTNITPNHTYTNAGTYIVTLNVTDTIGQWDEDTALVFVNNVGPTADAGSDIIVDEGEAVVFNANGSTDTASDLLNLTYTWYFGDGKTDTGMKVNHSYGDDGIYNATLVVTDDNGFVDSNITTTTVNNVAPTIEPVPVQIIQEDSLFTLKINATDVPADTLTFSDNTTLFDIDPITGMIEFMPTNDDVGNHSVNITVADDDGGVNYTVLNITVRDTNDAPVIESIGQQSAIEDVEFTLQVDASDVDVGDVLTYSLIDYPTGMSIDDTGLISWTPTNDDVGTHTITVKVEDAGGLYDTKSFTIIVSNVNDAPTILSTTLADATEDVFYMAFVHADDIDAGDSLIYSLDTYPAFISIDPLNGMVFGMPGNDDVGTRNVVVNVTDGSDYTTRTFSFTVINVNDSPTIASNPVLTADVGVEYSYDVIASDEDNDVLTFSLTESPDGMVINGSKITWTPTNEQQGKTYQVVVKITDGEITTTQSFVVSVGEIPEVANVWLALLLGLVGGLVSGVVMNWVMNQRKKEKIEEIEKPE